MRKRSKKFQKKGQIPGTLIYTGNKTENFGITVIDYDSEQYKEFEVKELEECFPFRDSPTTTWIDVVGLHKVDVIEKIGKHYILHPLVLEDILNVYQRPKVEYFEEYIFVVLKMMTYNGETNDIDSEQVSMILGNNFVFTFQEKKGDVFEPIRERIRNNKGVIRENGADYLIYSLIDIIVDNYFVILEKLGESVEDLEDRVVLNPSPETIRKIHRLKRNLIELRRIIWPLREALSMLYKEESDLIEKKTFIYFRDVYGHVIQIIDTIETLRDMLSGLLDVYLSSVSNKTNEIMKVLTIIATIFIPLTLISGIYGMNFKYMPELKWKFGYPFALVLMLAIAIGMLIYFRKKKWL